MSKKQLLPKLIINNLHEFEFWEYKLSHRNIWIDTLIINMEYVEKSIKIPHCINSLYFPKLKKCDNISFRPTHLKEYNQDFYIAVPSTLSLDIIPASWVLKYQLRFYL
jgi:hypothetical protein